MPHFWRITKRCNDKSRCGFAFFLARQLYGIVMSGGEFRQVIYVRRPMASAMKLSSKSQMAL